MPVLSPPPTDRACGPRIGSIQAVRFSDGSAAQGAVWRCDVCETWQAEALPLIATRELKRLLALDALASPPSGALEKVRKALVFAINGAKYLATHGEADLSFVQERCEEALALLGGKP
jgi:hypothetical protein